MVGEFEMYRLREDARCLLMALLITAVLVGSCGRTEESAQATARDVPKLTRNVSERARRPTSADGPVSTREEVSAAHTSASQEPADVGRVAEALDVLDEEAHIAELRVREKVEREQERARKAKEWEQEQARLFALYLEYSNEWERIPNESDRLVVAVRFIGDRDHAGEIVEALLDSAHDLTVAARAADILAFAYCREGNLDDAVRMYERGERRFLGNAVIEDRVQEMPDDYCRALSALYISKGVALNTYGDYEGLVDAFHKSALLSQYDPCRQANMYVTLAEAYAKLRDTANIAECLKKARVCASSASDEEQELKVILIKKKIDKYEDNLRRGILPSVNWSR